MYKLTLTKNERNTIDLVGYRYRHGDELFELLMECSDVDWNENVEITFEIPEHIAWEIKEIVESDENLACFSDELKIKLFELTSRIV